MNALDYIFSFANIKYNILDQIMECRYENYKLFIILIEYLVINYKLDLNKNDVDSLIYFDQIYHTLSLDYEEYNLINIIVENQDITNDTFSLTLFNVLVDFYRCSNMDNQFINAIKYLLKFNINFDFKKSHMFPNEGESICELYNNLPKKIKKQIES